MDLFYKAMYKAKEPKTMAAMAALHQYGNQAPLLGPLFAQAGISSGMGRALAGLVLMTLYEEYGGQMGGYSFYKDYAGGTSTMGGGY